MFKSSLVCLILCAFALQAMCRQKCTINPMLVRCSMQKDTVCAFVRDERDGSLVEMEIINMCQACIRHTTESYEEGRCTGQKVHCDPQFRSRICTREYFPVCAYSRNSDGKLTSRTAGNTCTACGDDDVEYYTLGACSE